MGHAGTLDPFATGLLIAASGKMTRIAGLLTDLDKEYEAVFRFGEETDTLDTEGKTVATAPVPDIGALREAFGAFSGEITQVPPAFSAVKINGRRAYERARNGQSIDMPERRVTIHELTEISWNSPDLTVRIRCSKGTYIRSIARDLALACGSRGYCLELRRTAIGPFRLDQAVAPDKVGVEEGLNPPEFFAAVGLPVISAEDSTCSAMRKGVPFGRISGFRAVEGDAALYIDSSGKAAALVEFDGHRPSYRIVFD